MPYRSLRQTRYFHANRKKLEAQGVDVDEWDAASRGKKLPEKVTKEAKDWGKALDRMAERRGVTRQELDQQIDSLISQGAVQDVRKIASIASSVAPITDVVGNVDMSFKDPKKLRQKSLSDRLTDIVDAEDTLNDPVQTSLGHSVGMGALTGGLLMGTKGALIAAGNPASAAAFTALGAGIGAGAGGLRHLLYSATKRSRERNARRVMQRSFNFDRSILSDPETRAQVETYRKAKYGPLFGAEGGATLGSLAGAMIAASRAPSTGPSAQLLGLSLPLSQAKAEAAGTGGLVGGLAGLGLGLAAGYGYRWYKRRALRDLLRKKLMNKTASIWLKDNKGAVTDLQGGRPRSASNRALMRGQDVDHYAAGMPQPRYPFTPVTEQPEQYAAGSRVKDTRVSQKRGSEVLVGGEADGKPTTDYPPKEVLEGAQHEVEHTDNPRAAVEIAKDHLEEDKDYYTKLEKMEKDGAARDWAKLTTSLLDRVLPSAQAPTKLMGDTTLKLPTHMPALKRPSALQEIMPNVRAMDELSNRQAARAYSQAPTARNWSGSVNVVPVLPNQSLSSARASGTRVALDAGRLQQALANMEKRIAAQAQSAAAVARQEQRASQVANRVRAGLGIGAGVGAAAASQTPAVDTPAAEQAPNLEQWAGLEGGERKVASEKNAGLTLRERSEVIITDGTGILAIKKPGYLLMPGGGLNDGESAEAAVVRESIEEADRLLVDLTPVQEQRVAYIGEGPSPGFDGELTHFYTARDGGTLGTEHPDREDFTFIPFEECLLHLTEALIDEEQNWAFDNNMVRIKAIESLMPGADEKKDELNSADIVRADSIEKKADAAAFLPKSEFVLFSKDGKLIVRRGKNRRFDLPHVGTGNPVPYERPIQLLPPEGVPEPGVHGYEVGLRMGETDTVPQGYEAVDPQAALKDMYASMGLAANRPYQSLDRARARAIVRYLKKQRQQVSGGAA
jgi:8-oxo-dGTP pyrophosphatase MutT (NUDIX family)